MKHPDINQHFEKACLQQALAAALRSYPEEVCGLFFENQQTSRLDLFEVCRNLQNDLHRLDAKRYPRNAQQAYAMDDQEIAQLEKKHAATHRLRAIFHSHNDAGVYFSAEDLAMACPWGEPLFPGLFYIIFAFEQNRFSGASAFIWDDKQKKFLETKLVF